MDFIFILFLFQPNFSLDPSERYIQNNENLFFEDRRTSFSKLLFYDNFKEVNSTNDEKCYEFEVNKCFNFDIDLNSKKENKKNYNHYYRIFSSFKRLIKIALKIFLEKLRSNNFIFVVFSLLLVITIDKIVETIINENEAKNDKINRENLKSFTESVLNDFKKQRFSPSYVKWLCKAVKPILLAEPSLLELGPPINICGDIHGQMNDLITAFKKGGDLPNSRYLFLGDYVDRGSESVEVICLLFCLKILYPKNIFLLRGNHESPEMNDIFGFKEECKKKLNSYLWNVFNAVFECLPVAAVVGNQYFCVHGGMSPNLECLQNIKEIRRPVSILDNYILSDILWTDPKAYVDYWGPNPRGDSLSWGLKIAESFLMKTNLKFIVRGHEMAQKGYEFPFFPVKNTITVFTASKYDYRKQNKAAIMQIDNENNFSFIVW